MIANKGNSIQAAEYAAARQKREMEQAAEQEVQKAMTPAKRTSVGLRNALFDEIDALRRGDGSPERAVAVAKLASTIIETVRVEIQYRKSGLDSDPTSNGMQLGSIEAEKK